MDNPNNKAERVAREIAFRLFGEDHLSFTANILSNPMEQVRVISEGILPILAREYPDTGELPEDAVRLQVAAVKAYEKLAREKEEWQKAQDADRSIESASELYQQGYEQGIAWQKAQDLAVVEAARPAQHNASSSAAAVNAWFIQQEMCDEIKRRISEE